LKGNGREAEKRGVEKTRGGGAWEFFCHQATTRTTKKPTSLQRGRNTTFREGKKERKKGPFVGEHDCRINRRTKKTNFKGDKVIVNDGTSKKGQG